MLLSFIPIYINYFYFQIQKKKISTSHLNNTLSMQSYTDNQRVKIDFKILCTGKCKRFCKHSQTFILSQ